MHYDTSVRANLAARNASKQSRPHCARHSAPRHQRVLSLRSHRAKQARRDTLAPPQLALCRTNTTCTAPAPAPSRTPRVRARMGRARRLHAHCGTAASLACAGKILTTMRTEPTRAPRCRHLLCCHDASGMKNAHAQCNAHVADGRIFQKATWRPPNANALSLALVATVALHRSCTAQQTCTSMRTQLPGHLPLLGVHSPQRKETRVAAVHSALSTPRRGKEQQGESTHSTPSDTAPQNETQHRRHQGTQFSGAVGIACPRPDATRQWSHVTSRRSGVCNGSHAQCTQVTCHSVGCLERSRHVGQCLISCAAAMRQTFEPAHAVQATPNQVRTPAPPFASQPLTSRR
ncbi:hypothetical protein, conserved in T. vivax [Trypanosoma vivax Y486]|uniref:Uncharacterized protein n=1 Tax=Trypanosoma vivax (strain Y486) TaxID=1055687 RepID=F9WLB5_TRYVY|nr:hypothetical protein, conserved in T. vivax [Trypanosoma vivax Y486]|eukprot:CCD18304.1 hypothetical protein, conserved in T. vivax [Trypanosoma vivax Y486]